MSGGEVALLTGLLSGGFALAGVGMNNWTTARRDRRRFQTETALELASIERFIWRENWIDLNVHLQSQEARLAVAGVPTDLIEALHRVAVASWYDLHHDIELGLPEPGIKTDLLHALHLVNRAMRAHLV